jgi:hypothetical protein
MDFPTDKALQKYLEEHPDADPSKHKVIKSKGLSGFFSKVKGLSQGVMDKLNKAPEQVKEFLSDEEHRNKVLSTVADVLKEGSVKAGKKVIAAAKDMGEDYKKAGSAIKKIVKGDTIGKEEKKALFSVGVTMATVAIAAASGGTALAMGTFGKSIIKDIAVSAVSKTLGKLNTLSDVGEVTSYLGQGLLHMLKTAEEDDPLMGFANTVLKEASDQLESGLSDDRIADLLKKSDKEAKLLRMAYLHPEYSDILLTLID